MSAGIKSLILLAATLVVGFALGLFADATLVRSRRESLRDLQRPPGFVAHMEEIIRPRSDPFGTDGGVAILYGNLAPDGAMVKTFSVPKEMHEHVGPARVFDREEDCLGALERQEVESGDVMVIRYEGPRGNGMPEMYFASAVLADDPVLGHTTALVTDGRYSGAMKGPSVGHVSPEAVEGGPIALVEAGDLIEISIPERRLAIVGLHGRKATEDEVAREVAERLCH